MKVISKGVRSQESGVRINPDLNSKFILNPGFWILNSCKTQVLQLPHMKLTYLAIISSAMFILSLVTSSFLFNPVIFRPALLT